MTGADPAVVEPAVIDASVGLKWVLPEPGTDAALRLRDQFLESGTRVHVPDLFWAETANVLWRLTRSRERRLDPAEARELLEVLRSAPVMTVPAEPLSGRALEIACATGTTAYDALYVAVAEVKGGRLWTADAELVGALTRSEWEARVSEL